MCNREAHTYVTWTLLSFVSQPHGLIICKCVEYCLKPGLASFTTMIQCKSWLSFGTEGVVMAQ